MMTTGTVENAETFLQNLKYCLDEAWQQFEENTPLNGLAYAKDHYGVMQRAELRHIFYAFADLKGRIDGLLAECSAIPADRRIPCYDLGLQAGEKRGRHY